MEPSKLKLMKGHEWSKMRHKALFPGVMEPKYDEIRLDLQRIPGAVLMLSYAGKPLHNLQPYSAALHNMMVQCNITRLDCGVLVNDCFDDTYRFTRSSKGVPKDLPVRTLVFKLYDLPNSTETHYLQRKHELASIARVGVGMGLRCEVPPAYVVANEEDVMAHYRMFVSQGLEGGMFKNTEHAYQNRKSADWGKIKPCETIDGKITAIIQGKDKHGQPLDRAGSVTVVFEDGSTCDAGGIKHELARQMLATPELFIGKWVEVKYMERDRQGGYRHPRFIRIREDKE